MRTWARTPLSGRRLTLLPLSTGTWTTLGRHLDDSWIVFVTLSRHGADTGRFARISPSTIGYDRPPIPTRSCRAASRIPRRPRHPHHQRGERHQPRRG